MVPGVVFLGACTMYIFIELGKLPVAFNVTVLL
jgi:hypothetical protein